MNPNAEHALFPHWFRILDTIMSWAMIVVFVRTEKHNNNIALHTRTEHCLIVFLAGRSGEPPVRDVDTRAGSHCQH